VIENQFPWTMNETPRPLVPQSFVGTFKETKFISEFIKRSILAL
jgi:hypothetical protein